MLTTTSDDGRDSGDCIFENHDWETVGFHASVENISQTFVSHESPTSPPSGRRIILLGREGLPEGCHGSQRAFRRLGLELPEAVMANLELERKGINLPPK